MKENLDDIIMVILILVFIVITLLFLFELKEFYNDYKCSTTTDVTYYNDNNCWRFER